MAVEAEEWGAEVDTAVEGEEDPTAKRVRQALFRILRADRPAHRLE